MSRANFFETIAIASGPGGSLVPLQNISFTPYTVNPDGSQGVQANAFSARTGNTPGTLVTDATGTVSYWLDDGDYDIDVADLNSPIRISSYMRGFTAASLDPNTLMNAAENVLIFSGDLKFSAQTNDHGLRSDGSYEWLLIMSAVDGGGRLVQQNLYPTLWAEIGSPAIDSNGNFRLPNFSGRTLIAAGLASGLSAYTLWQMLGEEAHTLSVAELAAHTHLIDPIYTGITIDPIDANVSVNNGSPVPQGHQVCVSAEQMGTSDIRTAGVAGGNNDWVPRIFPYGSVDWGGSPLIHNHDITQTPHDHPLNDPAHTHTAEGAGSSSPHNNLQPSAVANLFIKS